MNKDTYLFIGIRSFVWSITEWSDAIQLCKDNSIDGIMLKCWNTLLPGYQYEALGGVKEVYKHITYNGLLCMPWIHCYNVSGEAEIVKSVASLQNKICLDLESQYDGNNAVDVLLPSLQGKEIWVSTWSNPIDHDWLQNIEKLDTYVSRWLPQEYRNELTDMRIAQFPSVLGTVCPTYAVGLNTIEHCTYEHSSSLWEYGTAMSNPVWMKAYMQNVKACNLIGEL